MVGLHYLRAMKVVPKNLAPEKAEPIGSIRRCGGAS